MGLGVNNPQEALYFLAFVAIGLNFLISGVLINFVQLLMWVAIKPFSIWLYRKLNYYCIFAVWGRMLCCFFTILICSNFVNNIWILVELEFLTEWWSSSTFLIHTDDDTWAKMGQEHAILLLNHSYEVDWIFSWFFCEQLRMLGVCISIIQFLQKYFQHWSSDVFLQTARALVKKSFKVVRTAEIVLLSPYFSWFYSV